MPTDLRRATFARIGRSYPRLRPESDDAEHPSISGYKVAGALVAFLSAAGLIGWFLSR